MQFLFRKSWKLFNRQKFLKTINIKRLPTPQSFIELTKYALFDMQQLEKKLRINTKQKAINKLDFRVLKRPLKKQNINKYIVRLKRHKTNVIHALQLNQTYVYTDFSQCMD